VPVTISPRYRSIVALYDACLERHGDNHLGVAGLDLWPRFVELSRASSPRTGTGCSTCSPTT
jgi:hypothetical protein